MPTPKKKKGILNKYPFKEKEIIQDEIVTQATPYLPQSDKMIENLKFKSRMSKYPKSGAIELDYTPELIASTFLLPGWSAASKLEGIALKAGMGQRAAYTSGIIGDQALKASIDLLTPVNFNKNSSLKKQLFEIGKDKIIDEIKFAYGGEINNNEDMKKSKYKSKYKKEQLPQFGWGSTIGGIAGGALGTLLGPFGTMAGSSLGAALGNSIDGEENTQGNQIQMPQLNIDPVNTQGFYNPVKAYGGYLPDFAIGGGIPPAIFTNPNDPEYKRRLQAYNDSLNLYKKSLEWEANLSKIGFNEKSKKMEDFKPTPRQTAGLLYGNFTNNNLTNNNKVIPVGGIQDIPYSNLVSIDKYNVIYNKTIGPPVMNNKNKYIISKNNVPETRIRTNSKISNLTKDEFKKLGYSDSECIDCSSEEFYPYYNKPVQEIQLNSPKMWVNQAGNEYQYNLGDGKGWTTSTKEDLQKMKSQYQIQGSSDNNPFEFAFGGYMYPFGGQVNPNAEVEGNEVIQYQPGNAPQANGQGNMQQIASDMSVAQGPTHANGGIPIAAQPGSMVVSDRLPAPNTKEYKSIANKVEMLGRKKGQLEKKITANPNDKIAKDTIGLVQKQIDTLIQQQEQMKAQNSENIMAKAYQKAYGGTVTGNERLDKDFLNMWNTGSYAYGGDIDIVPPVRYNQSNELNPNMYVEPIQGYQSMRNKIYNKYHPVGSTYKFNEPVIPNGAYSKNPNYQESGAQEINYNTPDSYMPNYTQPTGDIMMKGQYPLQTGYSEQVARNRSDVQGIKLNPNGTMDWGQTFAPQANGYIPSQQSNTGSLLDYSKPTDINNPSGQNMSKTNLTGSEQDLFKTTVKNTGPKKPFMKTNMGSGLQYAAQYIPDIIASFTKKDKPIDPNMYMNQSRVNAARYDTSAEEAAVQDARNQAMLLAKESSGGDAGMYANIGNVANTGAYKNLGQVYNRAQNINMQNQMAADQANAGIEGQNRGMALNIANMNQADASAVEDRRMTGMQGIANKLANNYSQDRQFKLLKDIAPHYNYDESNGELTFKGKKYYGEEAKTLLEQLKMNTSNAYNKVLGFGQNLFGGGQ